MTKTHLPAVMLLIVGILLGAGVRWRMRHRVADAPLPVPARLTISISPERQLAAFAVSPDGRRVAYAAEENGRDYLFLGPLETSGLSIRLGDGSAGAQNPFFSPDGQWIAFFAGGQLKKIRADAKPGVPGIEGEAIPICEAPSGSAGGTWTDDGRIVFAPLRGQGLLGVPAAGGGTPTPLTQLDKGAGEIAHGWPHALPEGKGIVLTVSRRGHDPWLAVLTQAGEKPRFLLPATGQAHFVSTGHLVYGYFGNLMAVPFDATTLRTRGGPTPIAKDLQTFRGFGEIGRTAFSVSRRGSLAWIRGNSEDPPSLMAWVDRTGSLSRSFVSELGLARQYQTPRLSPDGKWIAVVVRSGLMTRDIRIIDVAHPERALLTVQGGDNHSPAWMPDGRRLTFASNRDGVQRMYVMRVQGGESLQPLGEGRTQSARNPTSWAHRVPLLAFYEIDANGGRDVWLFRPGAAATAVAATPANERSPALSPDGRWLAYVSDESGRDEVYVRRIGELDRDSGFGSRDSNPVQVSVSGGVEPLWARDGLLYRDDASMMMTMMMMPFSQTRPGMSAPRRLFERRFEMDPGSNLPDYDVSGDGQRLLMLKSVLHPPELRVVRNWGTELARLVPAHR